MAFWVYLLQCADGSFYAGHTDDLERRISEHESGQTGGYPAGRRPVRLVWSQECSSRDEALERERQIKRWSRAKKAALSEGAWNTLSQLAKKRFSRHSN